MATSERKLFSAKDTYLIVSKKFSKILIIVNLSLIKKCNFVDKQKEA